MTFLGLCATHVLTMILAGTSVWAQQAPAQSEPDKPDTKVERVTVKVAGSTREIRGRLLHLDSKTLTVDVDSHGGDGVAARKRLDLPLERVVRIDVEAHDSVIDGAILGAVFLAACAKWWCGQGTSSPPELPRDAWIGAGLGALVGASIDARFFRRTTIYQASGSAGPQPAGAGVSFRLRF